MLALCRATKRSLFTPTQLPVQLCSERRKLDSHGLFCTGLLGDGVVVDLGSCVAARLGERERDGAISIACGRRVRRRRRRRRRCGRSEHRGRVERRVALERLR
eukprot:Amastigsp_a845136_49.p9 type:complete len:103 gc:universal Amastigsp_a845136_49:1546-1238(-)